LVGFVGSGASDNNDTVNEDNNDAVEDDDGGGGQRREDAQLTADGRLAPSYMYRLYERYRDGDLVDEADTVRSIHAELALVNSDSLFVFNVSSIADTEFVVRSEINVYKKKQRRTRSSYGGQGQGGVPIQGGRRRPSPSPPATADPQPPPPPPPSVATVMRIYELAPSSLRLRDSFDVGGSHRPGWQSFNVTQLVRTWTVSTVDGTDADGDSNSSDDFQSGDSPQTLRLMAVSFSDKRAVGSDSRTSRLLLSNFHRHFSRPFLLVYTRQRQQPLESNSIAAAPKAATAIHEAVADGNEADLRRAIAKSQSPRPSSNPTVSVVVDVTADEERKTTTKKMMTAVGGIVDGTPVRQKSAEFMKLEAIGDRGPGGGRGKSKGRQSRSRSRTEKNQMRNGSNNRASITASRNITMTTMGVSVLTLPSSERSTANASAADAGDTKAAEVVQLQQQHQQQATTSQPKYREAVEKSTSGLLQTPILSSLSGSSSSNNNHRPERIVPSLVVSKNRYVSSSARSDAEVAGAVTSAGDGGRNSRRLRRHTVVSNEVEIPDPENERPVDEDPAMESSSDRGPVPIGGYNLPRSSPRILHGRSGGSGNRRLVANNRTSTAAAVSGWEDDEELLLPDPTELDEDGAAVAVAAVEEESRGRGGGRKRGRYRDGRRRSSQQLLPNSEYYVTGERSNGKDGAAGWHEPGTSCRKKQLVVDFADIGWNEWIISPKFFEAHYCDGLCQFPMAKKLRPTNHATIQSIVRAVGIQTGVPSPCCVPASLTSLTLLYFDENQNVVLKNYPEMSVRSCACR
jgi:hypothetical protein